MTVFDGHCDTAVELWRKKERLRENSGQVSLNSAEKLDGYLQFFAFCTAWLPSADKEGCFRQAYGAFQKELALNSGSIRLCTNAEQALQALREKKTGAFLSLEGAETIGCDEGKLDEAYEMGVRMIAPVWNTENALSGTCVTGGGLSEKGRAFCRRAQKLGILLDVSHLSDRGFWDLCDIAEKPIVASHSNSRAVCAHRRNLTDEQFLALCQLGGTAGINLYAPFLTEKEAAFDDVYRHIDHFLELGGGHTALGGDLDGCDTLPEGFCRVEDYGRLEDFLRGRGYSQEVLEDIFNRSLMKVVKQCII